MKVLVTGAAGFIGGQLWHALWKRGDEVVGIDNFSYGNLDNLKFEDHDFGPEVRRMDIRDREAIPALFEAEKFDVVYNIAGIAPLPDCQSDPVQAVEVNTLGLVHLLECARRTGVKQLVQASTNAMYENETQFPSSNDPNRNIYQTVKMNADYTWGVVFYDMVKYPNLYFRMNDGDHLVAYASLPAGTTTSCRMNVHTYVGQHM